MTDHPGIMPSEKFLLHKLVETLDFRFCACLLHGTFLLRQLSVNLSNTDVT
jgi:hypothetical protein